MCDDGLQPHRAIGARAGQDDGNGALALILCQGTEEVIDRKSPAADVGRLGQTDDTAPDTKIACGWTRVDVIGLQALAVFGRAHDHRGVA